MNTKTEQFIEKARKVHGDKYDYSKVNYVNSSTKVTIICPIHGEFEQTPNKHLLGQGCPKCAGGIKLTTKNFIEKARKVHGDKYDYSKVNYVNNRTKVIIICPEHGEFEQTPASHLTGSGCPMCVGGIKFSKEQFIEKAREVHGDKYNYSKVNYINANTKVIIICPEHGEFEQTPGSHLYGQGCPKCANNIKLTTEQFIEKAKEVHGDKYDYSKVNYLNSYTKVTIICPEHGEFEQTPANHLVGKGCPKCKIEKLKNNHKYNLIDFIEKARKVHGDKYDYSKVNYVNNQTKVTIICPIHGEFEQTPINHLLGCNCPMCVGGIKFSKEQFIEKAKEVHGDKYNYSKVNYINANTKVIIICPEHGEFEQTPAKHLNGQGCPKCSGRYDYENKLDLLTSGDLENMTIFQLLELIAQNHLPTSFKKLTTSAPNSKERKDTINELKQELEKEETSQTNNTTTSSEKTEELNSNMESSDDITSTDTDKSDSIINTLKNNTTTKLKSCDNIIYTYGERSKFITEESIQEIWNTVLTDINYINELIELRKTSKLWLSYVIDTFMQEYNEVINFVPNSDYKFKYNPTLMQKLMVYRIKNNNYYGNWCGTGAGKTNAALIASRETNSKITVIVCPNSVKSSWEKSINEVYTNNTQIKDIESAKDIINFREQYKDDFIYIILNYDKFNQPSTSKLIKQLLSLNTIDFICFDEIHKTKNDDSIRTKNIIYLRKKANEINENLKVLGMTATPLINDILEVKTLLELISGDSFDNIITNQNYRISNMLNAHKYLTLYGFRYIPDYNIKCNIVPVKIYGNNLRTELETCKNTDINKIDGLLIKDKFKNIKHRIKKGRTIIYTQYIKDIVTSIKDELNKNHIKFVEYTGEWSNEERNDSLQKFKNKEVDVLLASSPISTGVDGLQEFCDNIIIFSLPWTNAEFVQLIGRINRQGSKFKEVNIYIPQIYIKKDDGTDWSWDNYRYNIIMNKKTLSDAIVDGDFSGKIFKLNKQKLLQDAIDALKEGIQDVSVMRPELEIDEQFINNTQVKANESVIKNIHQKAHTSTSKHMHDWFTNNPNDWKEYHKQRELSKQTWEIDPVDVIAQEINSRNDVNKIADLGCGLAKLSTLVKKPNEVISVDHYSENPNFIKADIADLSAYIKDGEIDITVFCLSLWGTNYLDYIKEAYRITAKRGFMYIVQPKKIFIDNIDEFINNINNLGFQKINEFIREKFIYLKFVKN